jgi:hypothetical protein
VARRAFRASLIYGCADPEGAADETGAPDVAGAAEADALGAGGAFGSSGTSLVASSAVTPGLSYFGASPAFE